MEATRAEYISYTDVYPSGAINTQKWTEIHLRL
jgi:hypothetical protein